MRETKRTIKLYACPEGLRLPVSFGIAAAGTACLPRMLVTEGKGLAFSNSFLSVLVFLAALALVHRALWKDGALRRRPLLCAVFAFAFSTACCLGSGLETYGYAALEDAGLWAAIVFLTLFFTVVTGELWTLAAGRYPAVQHPAAGNQEERHPAGEDGGWGGAVCRRAAEQAGSCREKTGLSGRIGALSPAGRRAAVFFFLLFIWGIVMLAVYPGFFVYDAQDELNQVMTRSFTTHHPLPHVVLLGGIILAGNKLFGSYNAGIACYMLFQMAVMAGCFTYVTDFLRKKRMPLWMRAAAVCYFAFFPVIHMYVLCSAKDTLYSAGMLMMMVLLLEAAKERDAFFASKGKLLLLGAGAIVMASMRHNGVYILLLCIPVLTCWAGRGRRLAALSVSAGALVCVLLMSAGLKGVLHAQDEENQEMLTVPIQQLARTYALSPDTFTEQEEALLLRYLPKEALAQYRPKLSDGVKIAFQNAVYEEAPGEFWKLWATVGCRAPASYLNAWLMTSYGFWYPDTVIDVYRGNSVFTFTYEDSSYFGYETELPGTRESLIPGLDGLYRNMSLEIFQQRIPVLSMLFSPGFLFWVYMFVLGFVLWCGGPWKWGKEEGDAHMLLLFFVPAVLNWLTVLLGPTYLVRYVLIWWFALPVLGYVVREAKLCYTNTKTVLPFT